MLVAVFRLAMVGRSCWRDDEPDEERPDAVFLLTDLVDHR